MKRNDFFKKAIAGTVALFSINWNAIAGKKVYKQEKPMLTDGALNRFFAKCEEERNERPLTEAITDTRAFVEKYFTYISPEQRERIRGIKEADWRNIQSILRDVKQKRGLVEFKFINKPGGSDIIAKCQIQTSLMQKGRTQVELKKFIIE